MKVKRTLAVLVALAFALSLFAGGVFAEEDDGQVSRLAGDDRWETSKEIALEAYHEADTVIIAEGWEFADGLGGSGLAHALDAPVLLTEGEELSGETEDAIDVLSAEEAIILGGEAAISADVADELDALVDDTERIEGDERYDTAAAIADRVEEEVGVGEHAYIVNGFAPADSLAVAPKAAMDGDPILQVTDDGEIPEATEGFIDEEGIEEVTIIGGTAVVCENVVDALEGMDLDVERVSGDDRNETSVAVAEDLFEDPVNFLVANGWDGKADAMAGGYFGAIHEAPILYTSSIPECVEDYMDDVFDQFTAAIILGGEAVVPAEVQDEVSAKIEDLLEEIDEVTVSKDTVLAEYGTDLEYVKAQLKEETLYVGETENGEEYLGTTDWEAVDYDAEESGDYDFEGRVLAPRGFKFADDVDTAVDAEVTVTVEAPQGEVIQDYILDLQEKFLPRAYGTDAEHEAAQYLYDVYEELGYDEEEGLDLEMQEFTIADYDEHWGSPEETHIGEIRSEDLKEHYGEVRARLGDRLWTFEEHHDQELESGETVWQTTSDPKGAEGVVENAAIIDCGDGEQVPEEVDGNIALIHDSEEADEKVEDAVDAGADAVVFSTGGQAFEPGLEEEADVPVLGASSVHADWLQAILVEEGVEIEVDLEAETLEDIESKNVVATIEGEDDAPIITVSGHLDSVRGAPGANDNASGTTTLLKLAEELKDEKDEFDAEIRFANVGAEEGPLAGALHYVDQLSDDEIARHYNFNPDMVGTSDPDVDNLWVCTCEGEANIVTDMLMQADEELGHDVTELGEVAASDHYAFYVEGIPEALLIWMGEEEFVLEPGYHTPLDTVEDNISAGRLQINYDIVKEAVLELAEEEVTHEVEEVDAVTETVDSNIEDQQLEYIAETVESRSLTEEQINVLEDYDYDVEFQATEDVFGAGEDTCSDGILDEGQLDDTETFEYKVVIAHDDYETLESEWQTVEIVD